MELSIIIPAFNEENTIEKVVHEIINELRGNLEYEIIVVNDGSTDNTSSIAKNSGAKVIDVPSNMGYGAALKLGVKSAKFDSILFFDGDDAFYPEDIFKLLKHIEFCDMIIGARVKKEGERLRRGILRRIYLSFAAYLVGRKFIDVNSGFRIVKRSKIIPFLHKLPDKFSITSTLTMTSVKKGHSVIEVPIRVKKQTKGNKLRVIKDGITFPVMILKLAMYYDPLRVFSSISVTLILISILYGLYETIFYQNISDTTLLLFITGIQILLAGLLGDLIVQRTES